MVVAFDTWSLADRFNHHGIHLYSKRLLALFQKLAPEAKITIKPFLAPDGKNYANSLAASEGFEPVPARLLSHSHLWRLL